MNECLIVLGNPPAGLGSRGRKPTKLPQPTTRPLPTPLRIQSILAKQRTAPRKTRGPLECGSSLHLQNRTIEPIFLLFVLIPGKIVRVVPPSVCPPPRCRERRNPEPRAHHLIGEEHGGRDRARRSCNRQRDVPGQGGRLHP